MLRRGDSGASLGVQQGCSVRRAIPGVPAGDVAPSAAIINQSYALLLQP